ncbi:collagen alpha-2(VIII) chain-like [Mercenaria mercenaria]|uniref:collagen alpha-2(VIII) chain-like n=1 Tax=Mercenaria mercenaria TaxID=6596 RepID=UPI00234FACB7|nr:collagen alpha-2(VIII) chain-like [Mercenaria mercenaria]
MDAKLACFMVLICVTSPSSAAKQLVCNISYDDQLMDRMIMTQVKVETILSEVRKTEERIQSALDNFRQELNQQSEEYGSLRQEMTDFKESAIVPTVAFLAYNLNDASAEEGQILRFTTTKFDKGSGYDSLTGIYTTPVAGVYQFSVQLYIANGQWYFFHIKTEEKVILKTVFFDDAGSHYGSQTATGTAVLDANTRVWVESELSFSGNDFFLGHQHRAWNSFSGVLINTIN